LPPSCVRPFNWTDTTTV